MIKVSLRIGEASFPPSMLYTKRSQAHKNARLRFLRGVRLAPYFSAAVSSYASVIRIERALISKILFKNSCSDMSRHVSKFLECDILPIAERGLNSGVRRVCGRIIRLEYADADMYDTLVALLSQAMKNDSTAPLVEIMQSTLASFVIQETDWALLDDWF